MNQMADATVALLVCGVVNTGVMTVTYRTVASEIESTQEMSLVKCSRSGPARESDSKTFGMVTVDEQADGALRGLT